MMSSWLDQFHYTKVSEVEQLYGSGIPSPTEVSCHAVTWEMKRLEEKLYMWKEVRMNTILKLRDIADFMDSLGHQTSVVQVVGASGGVLASGLTMVGGIMTVLTAGTALPVLVAGAGMGLVSGLTGGAAILTNKVMTSKQMALVNTAIEVDTAATNDLAREMENAKNIVKVARAAGMAFTVGGLASSAKGLLDIVRGVDPGQTFLTSLSTMGTLVGENLNQDVGRMIVQASGSVLAGTVTTMFGGVTLMWDIYFLRSGIRKLATGGEEGAEQIRNIASQLEEGLHQFFVKNQNDLDWFNLL